MIKPKSALRVFLGVCVLAALSVGLDAVFQPKVRTVVLQDVPSTETAPEVTFMSGAMMDPPILTNPFLVIFSPLEGLTARSRVVSGSLSDVSDSESVFVWETFGIRSVWMLDRSTRGLTPLLIRPGGGAAAWLQQQMPVLLALVLPNGEIEIRGGPTPYAIKVKQSGNWVEMILDPQTHTIWPAQTG